MGETVDEIQRRFSPRNIRRQAKDTIRETVRDTAQGAGNRMLETIKDNPIPSLIAGLSVGWLVAKGSSSSGQRRHYGGRYDYGGYERERYTESGYSPGYYEEEYAPGAYQGPAYAGGEAYDEDDEEGRSVGERAGEAARRVRGTAEHYGHEARYQARRATDRAERAVDRATHRAERMIDENPLAAGVATLALGAFAGLMLPGTRVEDRYMGEARDRTVHQAQEAAQETMERAKHVAERTAESAKETAKEETKKEKEEMQSKKQGS